MDLLAIAENMYFTNGYLPTEDHNGKELASWKLDKEIRNYRLPNELCDIHNGSEPTVLIADKICVFDETKDGGIAQGCLVK